MSGVYRNKIYLLISEHVIEGQGTWQDISRNKGASRHCFPPTSQPRHLWEPAERQCSTLSLLTVCPNPTFSWRHTPPARLASVWAAAVPLKHALGQSPAKAVPQQHANRPDRGQHHSKVAPALGEGNITTHTYLTAPLWWEETSDLTTDTIHQWKPLRGQRRESDLQFGAPTSLANAWSDLTQAQGGPGLAQ